MDILIPHPENARFITTGSFRKESKDKWVINRDEILSDEEAKFYLATMHAHLAHNLRMHNGDVWRIIWAPSATSNFRLNRHMNLKTPCYNQFVILETDQPLFSVSGDHPAGNTAPVVFQFQGRIPDGCKRPDRLARSRTLRGLLERFIPNKNVVKNVMMAFLARNWIEFSDLPAIVSQYINCMKPEDRKRLASGNCRFSIENESFYAYKMDD